jgi:lysozyme family protein
MPDFWDSRIDALIGREGAYSNNPNDAGGETMWGITVAEARANGYTGPMAAMPRSTAATIYLRKYVIKPGFDKVSAISPKVADELFDTGVNMGVDTASKFFQRALNVLNGQARDYPDIQVDGAIGAGTIAAFGALLKKRGLLGETVMLRALNCLQGARYIELAEGRSGNEDFEFGWLANRVGIPA